MVEYDGSTLKGFSGAPYAIGGTVFGMHVAGTKHKNLGISQGLISLMIMKMERVQEEASEDFYTEEIEQMLRANQFAWTYSHPLEHDEVVFMDRKGRYHTVDSEWFDALDITDRARERGFKPEGRLENKAVVTQRTVDVCTETPLHWVYENVVEVVAEANMELEAATNSFAQVSVKTKSKEVQCCRVGTTIATQTDPEPVTKVKVAEVQTEIFSDGESFLELTKESADVPGDTKLGLPGVDVNILRDIKRNLHRTQGQQTECLEPLATIGPQQTLVQPNAASSSSSTEHSKLEASFAQMMKEVREMKKLWEQQQASPGTAPVQPKKLNAKQRYREQVKELEREIALLRLNQGARAGKSGSG